MTSYRCPSTPARHRVTFHAALVAIAVAAVTTTICAMPTGAFAADDIVLQRLATCQDSWYDWKEGDPRMTQYTAYIASRLAQADGAAFTPTAPMTVFSMPVSLVFPQSVGTGVGFSMMVGGDIAQVRKRYEAQLGKPMTCATSDGSPTCELQVSAKKTVILMSEGPRSRTTLAGCYYFYQK